MLEGIWAFFGAHFGVVLFTSLCLAAEVVSVGDTSCMRTCVVFVVVAFKISLKDKSCYELLFQEKQDMLRAGNWPWGAVEQ